MAFEAAWFGHRQYLDGMALRMPLFDQLLSPSDPWEAEISIMSAP
jgi:hypothetical protein